MNNQTNLRCLRAVQELIFKYQYYIPFFNRVRFYTGRKDVKTMSIDANLVIYVNDEYADTLDDDEINGIILHEVLHFVLGHHERYINNPYKDIVPHSIHNIAMDMEINEIVPRELNYYDEISGLEWDLRNEGASPEKIEEEIEKLIDEKLKQVRLPESVFRAKIFDLPINRSYEEYLGILHNDMPDELKSLMDKLMSNSLEINDSEPDTSGSDSSESDSSKTNGFETDGSEPDTQIYPFDDINMEGYSEINKQLLYELIDECEELHKERMESYSGDVVRTIGNRKYSWDVVFRNIISTKVADIIAGFKYRTYLKPNRRYFSPDIIFSAYIDYSASINVAIIMDVSGSMGHMINEMYSTIKSIIDIQELKIKCTILETTDIVVKVIHNFDYNARQIESKDGGGTHMPAGWHYLINNDMDKDMDLIVCMTDTGTEWEPLLLEKSVVLGSVPVKPVDCPYTYFPVIFPESDFEFDYDNL